MFSSLPAIRSATGTLWTFTFAQPRNDATDSQRSKGRGLPFIEVPAPCESSWGVIIDTIGLIGLSTFPIQYLQEKLLAVPRQSTLGSFQASPFQLHQRSTLAGVVCLGLTVCIARQPPPRRSLP